MPTIGSTSKPAYVYDSGTDTWIPIGPGEHTHDYASSAHNHDSTYIAKTLTTTTGDIIYASAANTPARLGIGSTDQVLKVSGGIPAWGSTPNPAFVGVNAYRPGTSSTLTANTWYYVPLTAELYDTDNFHDNSTNNERFTIPSGKAGKYRISATARGEGGADYVFLYIFKNTGATELQPGLSGVIQRQNNMASNNWGINASFTTDLAVGDYLRVGILVSTTTTNPLYCVFSAEWLGA
jgi:hypothetical protein